MNAIESIKESPISFKKRFPLAAILFHSYFFSEQRLSRSHKAMTVAQATSRASFFNEEENDYGTIVFIVIPAFLIRPRRALLSYQLPSGSCKSIILLIISDEEREELNWGRFDAFISYFSSSLESSDIFSLF